MTPRYARTLGRGVFRLAASIFVLLYLVIASIQRLEGLLLIGVVGLILVVIVLNIVAFVGDLTRHRKTVQSVGQRQPKQSQDGVPSFVQSSDLGDVPAPPDDDLPNIPDSARLAFRELQAQLMPPPAHEIEDRFDLPEPGEPASPAEEQAWREAVKDLVRLIEEEPRLSYHGVSTLSGHLRSRSLAHRLDGAAPDMAMAIRYIGGRSDTQREGERTIAMGLKGWTPDGVFSARRHLPPVPDLPRGAKPRQIAGFEKTLRIIAERKLPNVIITQYQHVGGQPPFDGTPVNLTGVDIGGLDLDELNFSVASFEIGHIHDCKLESAWLQNASFNMAIVANTILDRVNAQAACFSSATIRGCTLREASLNNALFNDAVVDHTGFQKAQMTCAEIRWARFSDCDFTGADLRMIFFYQGRLQKVDFTGADLRFSYFSGMACDAETNFSDADLTGAAVRSTDFSGVKNPPARWNRMFGDASVILPDGVERPRHWPDKVLKDPEYLDLRKEWRSSPASFAP